MAKRLDNPMQTIIAGSRTITELKVIEQAVIQSKFKITNIIAGGAKGVDSLAIDFAKLYQYPYLIIPAEWNKHGKSAGYKRNICMGDIADQLIAVWDGLSHGTKHMIEYMTLKHKPVYVYTLS